MLRDRGRPRIQVWLIAAALGAGCSRDAGTPASGSAADARRPAAAEQPAGTGVAGALASASPDLQGSAATSPSASSPSAAASSATAALPAPERPFARVELSPTQGDLTPLLREHVTRARDKRLRPFVEFYADWCKPCRDLSALMEGGRMIEALRSTYIIKVNVDDWQDKLRGTGFVPREIPVFYAIGGDGRPTGRQILGYLKGEKASEKLIHRLGAFFQG
jgi:hypothetical protein